jgi:hypothetical protein
MFRWTCLSSVFASVQRPCDVHSIPLKVLTSPSGSIPRRISFTNTTDLSIKCQAGESLVTNTLECSSGQWSGQVLCSRSGPPYRYSDPETYYRFSSPRSLADLGCAYSTDLLLDWRQVKSDLASVIASGQALPVFMERIHPQLVRFENFFRHHRNTSFTDCPLGYFAIRAYLTLIVFPDDREVQKAELADHLASVVAEYPLGAVLTSGWFVEIIAPILSSLRAVYSRKPLDQATETVAALAASDIDTADRKIKSWLDSSALNFFEETMSAEENIFEYLSIVIERPEEPRFCPYQVCPSEMTWDSSQCECIQVFVPVETKSKVCIFVSDSRQLGSLDEELDTLRYWQLAYRVNALYAELHGYKHFFYQPEPSKDRKIGWAKVLFMLETMKTDVTCEYGVSIDSDAIVVTNERMEAFIAGYGLYDDRHFLFGEEYHQEEKADEVINANGGFFVVRNSAIGLQILKEWYDVPTTYATHKQFAKENPQGLNFCWDSKIHHTFKNFISYAHPKFFSAPYSLMVRHNWFKDQAFEIDLRRIILDRLHVNNVQSRFD